MTAQDYIGVTLYAKRQVITRKFASDSAPAIETVKAGELVGKIFSWVQRGNDIWWMFDDSWGSSFYVKHQEGFFSWSDADNQIIKENIKNSGGDPAQFEKELRNANLEKWAVRLGLGWLGWSIIKSKLNSKSDNDS